MTPIERHYENGEIDVRWQPALCVHCETCWRGLPQVFDPESRPWVNMRGASTEQIVSQIGQCPSGALSYEKLES